MDLREILLDAPLIVVLYEGPDATIELFSRRAREAVGGRDLTGRRLSDVFPELAAYLQRVVDSVRAGRPYIGINEPFTLDWTGQGKPETRYLSIFWEPVRGDHGSVERSVMFAFDVTAMLVGPRGESGDVAWLHATLDCIPTPIVLAEPETGKVSFANAAALELSRADLPSGTTLAQAAGFDVGYYCTDPAGAALKEEDLPAVRVAKGQLVEGMELMWHTPHGVLSLVCFAETVPATVTLPTLIVMSFFDLTAVRALQRALREAQHGREEFLTLAAHELRTPLTALKLRTSALLAKSPGSHGLAAIERAAGRMEQLVENMLEAERIRVLGVHPQPQELDLCEMVDRVIGQLSLRANPSGSSVSRLGARELRGQWDRELLERAVSNLVRNALRFGRGKPVRITCSDIGERVSIAVADEGIGIAPEEQEHIFDRFARGVSSRNFGGLGLGLWITRRIVTAMGGTVGVSSAIGKGATFTIELPTRSP